MPYREQSTFQKMEDIFSFESSFFAYWADVVFCSKCNKKALDLSHLMTTVQSVACQSIHAHTNSVWTDNIVGGDANLFLFCRRLLCILLLLRLQVPYPHTTCVIQGTFRNVSL